MHFFSHLDCEKAYFLEFQIVRGAVQFFAFFDSKILKYIFFCALDSAMLFAILIPKYCAFFVFQIIWKQCNYYLRRLYFFY